jgi:anti-sigma B factor antagonist
MYDSRAGSDAIATPFTVEVVPDRDRVVVEPHGELDLATTGELRDHIDDLVSQGFGTILLDLRRLEFMDSAGLRLVIEQTTRGDATVTVVDGAGPVRRLLELTGVRDELPLEPAV